MYLAYFESFIVYKMLISHVMCLKRLMNVTVKRSQLFYLGLWACQSYISLHRKPTDSYIIGYVEPLKGGLCV